MKSTIFVIFMTAATLASAGPAVQNHNDSGRLAATTVKFGFASDRLTPEAKQELDQMVRSQIGQKRNFIVVVGFTGSGQNVNYNETLGQRRANAVADYLVAQHEVPAERIQMAGLGKQKPVEGGQTSVVPAKSRRVKVTLYSLDQDGAVSTGAFGQ